MASSSFFLLLLLLLLLLLRLLLFVRGFVSHHYKALRQKPINTSSSSSSSSSSGLRWKYDVFINFRGEDTRRGFVSHLYRALRQKPLNTFIDTEELRKGDRLSELLTAIRESRLSIVVFSQNYASSTWCLKELVEILECNDNKNQIVVPIFYEVDPSDIRKLKGSFAEAFDRHEGHSNANMEEVRSWRSALTRATNLSGWDSRNYEDDAKLIEEIVEYVYRKLIHISSTSSKAKGLIEMDSHMHEMHLLLHPPGVETNDVRVVGIWGMGGLGKTTIARAVRDEIASQFEACCFLENVKEGFMKHGQLHMQTQLLSSISNNKVGSSNILDKGFQISSRFLKPDKKTVDLVGNEKMKASTNVRHIVLPCSSSARSQLIPDIIRCYSSGGRTIIFTETKEAASGLAEALPGARALHGDIQQGQREVTLAGFRSGKFLTLVATNVAARGLDINDVQLIIQCEPPRDVEDYIHRSGRTGRAGNSGVAVMLYDPRRSNFSKIERESGVKFEHISAPQPLDIAKAVGQDAAEMITKISDGVIPAFKSVAEELLNTSGLSAVDLLAKALAKAAGYTEIKKRSLLSSMEDHVTVLLEAGKPIYSPSFLPEEKVESVKGMALTADGNGAVFYVASEDLDLFLAGQENAANVSITVLKSLPYLQEKESRNTRFGGGGRFGRGGGGGFRNDRYSNNRSGGGGGGGRGRGNRW
ncbi:DEAD-box ATP-dependent RNA helicase 7-like isoform X2 [Pyrus x bretschneideri]|uniref:DEAD-box ATP-dependent RNA helicase 7-like isoform X2 n=1 Tax=Pyrus x bretschneideri TaxID=225117 RepID=UPI00202E2C8F|nr:DEAD-box ATP-dependent RNA helicase 7-like isoform X2 [Pyrus x bretschneideri]